MVAILSKTERLGIILDKATNYGKRQYERTSFHILRQCRQAFPDVTYKDLAPHLITFCSKHKLDGTKLTKTLCWHILDDEQDTSAPFYDMLDVFVDDPSNSALEIELPDTLPGDDPNLKALACAGRYLSKNTPDRSFYLSCRKGAELLEAMGIPRCSHMSVGHDLDLLFRAGVFSIVHKGKKVPGDDEKTVTFASEYIYNEDAKKPYFTQYMQDIQYRQNIHHPQPAASPQQTLVSQSTSTTPKPKPSTKPAAPVVVQTSGGGGGATLPGMDEEKPLPRPLGEADDIIAQCVEKRHSGVLGALPKQQAIPEPPRATATASGKEKSKTMPSPIPTSSGNTQGRICPICGVSSWEHTHEDTEAHWAQYKAQCAVQAQTKKKTTSERCKTEVKKAMLGLNDNRPQDLVKADVAAILARFLGSSTIRTINHVSSLIDKYRSKFVIAECYQILDEIERGVKFGSPLGILNHRLGDTYGESVAV